MDNITHTLAGVALAELLTPNSTGRHARRVVLGAAIVAANAPDLDFAYIWITEPPLGFLLHHRGHTHTVAGAIGLAGLILLALRLWSGVRREVTLSTSRLAAILGLAVLSHVLIDATNVFGVVFWYPFSTTWVFGDVSFIFEPWLWLLLGVPVARQAATATRVLVLVPISVAILAAAAWSLIPASLVLMLAVVGAVWWQLAGRVPARHRMTMALGGAVALFVVLAGLSMFSREQFVRESGPGALDGVVLDVVLEPDPATPWCWSGLVVSRDAAVDGSLKVRRGTVSLLPRVWPAASCVSAALFGSDPAAGNASGVVWTREWTMPLERLRQLDETDCAAAAWFRFSRAPMVIESTLRDLRLENPVHDNFTALALERTVSECPSNVPPWTPPRADVLNETVAGGG